MEIVSGSKEFGFKNLIKNSWTSYTQNHILSISPDLIYVNLIMK